jgi:hypothetical protein
MRLRSVQYISILLLVTYAIVIVGTSFDGGVSISFGVDFYFFVV